MLYMLNCQDLVGFGAGQPFFRLEFFARQKAAPELDKIPKKLRNRHWRSSTFAVPVLLWKHSGGKKTNKRSTLIYVTSSGSAVYFQLETHNWMVI